jgi:hypothetical protein
MGIRTSFATATSAAVSPCRAAELKQVTKSHGPTRSAPCPSTIARAVSPRFWDWPGGGAQLAEIYAVVPLAASQALGFAITTFRGTAHIGLHANHPTMPDPD